VQSSAPGFAIASTRHRDSAESPLANAPARFANLSECVSGHRYRNFRISMSFGFTSCFQEYPKADVSGNFGYWCSATGIVGFSGRLASLTAVATDFELQSATLRLRPRQDARSNPKSALLRDSYAERSKEFTVFFTNVNIVDLLCFRVTFDATSPRSRKTFCRLWDPGARSRADASHVVSV